MIVSRGSKRIEKIYLFIFTEQSLSYKHVHQTTQAAVLKYINKLYLIIYNYLARMLLVPLTLLRPSSSATLLKAGKVGESFKTSHILYSDHLHDCKSFQCKFLFTGREKHRFVHFVFTSIVQKVAIFNSQMRKNLCYEYCNDPFVKASRLVESSSL